MSYLITALAPPQSRASAEAIAHWIGNDPVRLRALIDQLGGSDAQRAQYAAWPLRIVGEAHPELLMPHWETLLSLLGQPAHAALRRNVLALASQRRLPWPESLLGLLVDHCFRLLASPTEPVAVKAHALANLHQAVQYVPGLKPELQAIIEAQLPGCQPAFASQARKVLHTLRQITCP